MAKITERCEKNIKNLINEGNKFLMDDNTSGPYNFVMWDYDWASIHELYLAYKSTTEQVEHYKNENNALKGNFTEHLNALEAENEKLKEQMKGLHKECRCDTLATLEAENNKLNEVTTGLHKECRNLHNTINILRADNSNQSHEIHKLKTENDEIKDVIMQMEKAKAVREENFRYLEDENERLREKVGELHTIKKSFEVLRALYLGDYENDEPF